MPKVDHDWITSVTGNAVAERPSQSTPGMPNVLSTALRLPLKASTMLKMEPMITLESTTGKK